ncbi:kinase-like protein [Calocera viscosa TUFC12733]|uniref:Kinase-like protein n=1 Tax=Calocera viscosa (strain TUFC12733) TaxID=1330018 RepID=A0A167PQL2_CALVF|nr:kinase-like protein [Calocera viscosa TUFC12733]
MTTWIRLSHPNVLELYGISAHGAYKFALVSPWMEYGDVTGYIRTYPHVKRSALVLDIIQGLSYLHSLRPPIVHGHLTGKNVLIRPTGKACLAHVGLAAVWLDQVESAGDSAEDSCVSPVYALRWLSPERVMPEHYGLTVPSSFIPEADIYAFGMVVYEIFAGKLPFYDFLNPWAVLAAIHRGERPQHPGSTARENGLSDTMWGIVQDCWQENYKERPSANELVERVAAVVITDHVSDL